MKSTSDECDTTREACVRLLQGRSREQLLFCSQYLTSPQHLMTPEHLRTLQPVPDCKQDTSSLNWHLRFPSYLLLLSAVILATWSCWPQLRLTLGANPCLVPNNFALMEATRPVSNCDLCSGALPVRLHRPSRAEFASHAYRGRPVLVNGATETWPARQSVDLAFLRRLYARAGANGSAVAEDGCQFLAFRSPLESLQQLLEATDEDAATEGPAWYIGWSNCDPRVAEMLRGLYSWPEFLPEEGEGSAVDWIFMGTPGQGTAMHIDSVHRPSWQAQIRGSKRWRLRPPPECEHLCRPLTVDVRPGDIFLLDTNQWYHSTEVIGSEMSITIGSEYD